MLKSCPFCGSKVDWCRCYDEDDPKPADHEGCHRILCSGCKMMFEDTKLNDDEGSLENLRDQTEVKWNNRFINDERKNMETNCVGLFGTCGNSTWRDAFVAHYDNENINYFNPQVPNGTWKPEDAVKEAEHLVSDSIVFFPVTGETYGLSSMAEIGFLISSILTSDTDRYGVIMVDTDMDENLKSDAVLYKESSRMRAIVKAHLSKIRSDRIFVVNNFDEALQTSKRIYQLLEGKTAVLK